MRIAIQGGIASFHHAAALNYFPRTPLDLIPCDLFSQVCEAVSDGKADRGIMAIENTLAGSILPNYLLLMAHSLHIVGELHLKIDQNLMAIPGQTLREIHTARSHPMALLQCSDFFHANKWIKPEQSFDTADSARDIRQQNLRGVAAIAGRLAAELYELEIIAANIENQGSNFTRFLILSREMLPSNAGQNKATVTFSIRHQPGALVEALRIFGDLGCNLTLIQSVPITGKPYEYLFCVDFEFDSETEFNTALIRLRQQTDELTLIGTYRRGTRAR